MKVGECMNQKLRLLKIAEENNGIVLSKQATDLNISRAMIKSLVNSGELNFVQRGIYVTNDGYVDDFFLIGHKFKSGIFSHETALYLLGFLDRVPNIMTMTFKHGTSTTRMRGEGVRPVMISKNFELGEISILRNGSFIRVYEIERTLVDLLKPRYDTDYEQLIPALKYYANYDKKDINKLFRYAKVFGVEEQIHRYMEVLL